MMAAGAAGTAASPWGEHRENTKITLLPKD
jgi:hypothetical protein